MAQLVARLVRNEKVRGSNPLSSTARTRLEPFANGNVGRGSGLVCVCGPGQRVGVDLGVEEHLEGSVVLGAQLVVLVDEDLGEERPIAQPPVGVVAAGVDVGAVGQESEGVVEVGGRRRTRRGGRRCGG